MLLTDNSNSMDVDVKIVEETSPVKIPTTHMVGSPVKIPTTHMVVSPVKIQTTHMVGRIARWEFL